MKTLSRVTAGALPLLPRRTLARPRLIDTLLETEPGGVVLLAAPYGYGATTVAAQVAHGSRGPVVWIDSALAELRPAIIDSLIGDDDASWIVLDGINPRLADHRDVVDVVLSRSQRARVLITTHDPTWKPGVAPSRLLRLDARALAFDDDEAVRLALALSPDVDADELNRLVALAAGWPLVIVRAVQHGRSVASGRGSHWVETDGAEELMVPWVNSLPGQARELLEGTAILDRLTAGLCDAVTGRGDTGEWLAWLVSDHGFVRDVSDGMAAEQWFERHPVLTMALRRSRRGIDVTGAHTAAAEWFAGSPYVDARIHHLLAAGLVSEAAETLLQFEDALFEEGAADRVVRWYAELPETALGPRGAHLLRIGWGRALSGDRSGAHLAAGQLAAVTSHAEADAPEPETLPWLAELCLLRGYLAGLDGDPHEMAMHARRAIELFAGASGRNSHQLGPLLLIRALVWSGDISGASREVQRAAGLAFETDVLRESVLAGLASVVATAEGRVAEGAVGAHLAAEWHASQGLTLLHASAPSAAVAYGYAEIEAARLKPGMSLLREVIHTARDRRMAGEAVYASAILARGSHMAGDSRGALRLIAEARSLLSQSSPASAMGAVLGVVEAEIRLSLGDVARAERLIMALPPSDDRSILHAWLSLLRQATSAERALSAIEPETPRGRARVQVLLALAALKRSSRLAETHLLRAADIAQEYGMELLLATSPESLLACAETAARRSGHDALARYAATARALRASAGRAEATRDEYRVLSPGEVELLALLAGRETNVEIAAILSVSVNTVKTRLARLYRKMGVGSRNELLKLARERGLLA